VLPIVSLSNETARLVRGVCFDIDDTVTTRGILDPLAYAALHELAHAGLKLIAVTGRPLGWAELVARQWPVDAAVGENGAGYFARTPSGVRAGFWDDEATRTQQRGVLDRILSRVAREMPHVRSSDDSWARRCDLAFDVNEHRSLAAADIEALAALVRAEGATVSVSSVHLHAQLGGHDKAQGVARAASELFAMNADEVREAFLFVGDSGNDAAAFAWFAHTAGVANVVDHLARIPVPPRYVANARTGLGFAEIAHILLERRAS
jgi:HAD superfamily hydrolase (TIGR01484 family)